MVQQGGVAVRLKLSPTDWVVLLYNLSLTVLILATRSRLESWDTFILGHLVTVFLVTLLARNHHREETRFNRWLTLWYPIILMLWLYPESGLLRHTILTRDLDPELILIETELFPERYYFTLPLSLSLFTLEFLHAVYFSYYLMLWVPGMIAQARQKNLVHEYIFVLSFVMFTHFWITILLPADGPVSLRQQVMPEGVLFIPVMNFIYALAETGGSAFPSTHAAASIVAVAYASKLFPKARRLLLLWLFLLLISTVVCTFHYSIDTIVGVFTGTLFLWIGKKLYEKIS